MASFTVKNKSRIVNPPYLEKIRYRNIKKPSIMPVNQNVSVLVMEADQLTNCPGIILMLPDKDKFPDLRRRVIYF